MKKIIILTLSAMLSSGILNAQVTIGADEKPANGALLHLKETGTTTKGLGMPVMKLTDENNLYPMFETAPGSATANDDYNSPAEKATQDAAHEGLVVYNTEKCNLEGSGLYVWNGSKWKLIGEQTISDGIYFNKTYFDLPSGRDLRTITPETLVINWFPSSSVPTLSAASAAAGHVQFTGTPLSPTTFTTSPTTMVIHPDPMTVAETSFPNPWRSKETTLIFSLSTGACGERKVVLNQTNYAMLVEGSTTEREMAYTGNNTSNTIYVESNAEWTISKSDPHNLLTSSTPDVGVHAGSELKNSTSSLVGFDYTMQNQAASKYKTAVVKFTDTHTPKRFNDITINIKNCYGSEPTFEELRDALVVANGGTLPENTPGENGVAWHTDQDGNIFLSMNYDIANPKGNNNRWMLTNLIAKNFATTGRTGSDNSVNKNFGTTPSATHAAIPQWAYPKGHNQTIVPGESASAEFTKTPRLGLLYNRYAVTNSQTTSVSDLEGAQNYPAHRKIQGICPNGWHLPSDWEWTELENVFLQHTSHFSNIPDINPLNANTLPQDNSAVNFRPTPALPQAHGTAMQDACQYFPETKSNSLLTGGFSVLLSGSASGAKAEQIGVYANFWSSSSAGNQSGWQRIVGQFTGVGRYKTNDSFFLSVRCKKD